MKTVRLPGGLAASPAGGFTVVELMVVVGIIAILAVIFAVNLPKIRAGFELRNAASLTVSEVRRAQAGTLADARYPYTVEFVVGTPGQLRIYKAKLSADVCPPWMTATSSTLCTRTVTTPSWPSTVILVSTTLLDCSPPLGVAIAGNDNCVTFGFLGAPTPSGSILLQSATGGTATIVIEPATGKVSIQ